MAGLTSLALVAGFGATAGAGSAATPSTDQGASAASPSSASAVESTTAGTDFWVTFPPNSNAGATFDLFVGGASAASGTVTEYGGNAVAFQVHPGTLTSLAVTDSVPAASLDNVVNEGVHVTSSAPVTIYGLNAQSTNSADAFTALPTDALGTRYRVASYTPDAFPSRLTVVAPTNGTTITVTPDVTVGSRTAGTPYTVALNQGQVYTLAVSGADLTGSLVTSNLPVAVYGSVDGVGINVGGNSGFDDLAMQELPPTTAWGTDFVSVRYLKAADGDPFRVIADTDGTVVTVNGTVVATLDAGQFFDGIYGVPVDANLDVGVHIHTSQPALVMQYQTGGTYTQGATSVSGDPSMMVVPPDQQYLASYAIGTPPTQFAVNDLNVTVPTSAVSSFRLDGAAVSPSAFTPIAGTTFSGAQLPLALGSHRVSAAVPFGVFVYGENVGDSYAYPGGYAVAPIAEVASLAASSPVAATPGTRVCIPVTVLDSAHQPVAGVAVAAAVSGANTAATVATSNGSGVALVCYTGTTAGTDHVGLSAGSVSATVVVHQSATVTGPASPTGGSVATTPLGAGYWTLDTAGTLTESGNAPDLGSENGQALNAPLVAVAATTTGKGYWLAASDGGVFTFGDARFYGSLGALHLNAPIVAMIRTPTNHGYWLIAADGGVFAFGDATFYGSLGNLHLNQPVVAAAATPDSRGYWLTAADGGVFTFGDAAFYGSSAALDLNRPVLGIASTPNGHGYWLISADGGVFTYGDAPFYGSLGGTGTVPIVGIIDSATGYRLISPQGAAYPFGPTS